MNSLVDSQQYTFTYNGKRYQGYYDSELRCFIDNDNISYPLSDCHNIKRA